MSEPREWEIMNCGIRINGKTKVTLAVELALGDNYSGDGTIRVVEFSAYEAMQARAEAAEKTVDKMNAAYLSWCAEKETIGQLREKVASLERWKIDHERGMRVCGCGASGDDVIKRDYSYECKKCGCSWMSSQQQTDQVCRDNEGLLERFAAIICNGPMSVEEHSERADQIAREAIAKFGGEK